MFPQFPGAPPTADRNGGAKAREAPPEPDNLEFIFPRRAMRADVALERHDEIAPLRDLVHDPPRPGLAPATADARTDQHAEAPGDRAVEVAPLTEGERPTTLADATDRSPEPGDDAGDADHHRELDDDVEYGAGPVMMDASDSELSFDLDRDDADDDDDNRAGALPDLPLAVDERPAAPRVLDMEAMMRASARTGAFRPATRLLLTLVAGFALLALFLRANPARSEGWLGRIPLVGTKLTAEPALGGRITLSDVQGGYQRLRTGRRIFVISGKAINNALVPVERIEVEGALYAASGSVDRKVISTGNRTTLKLRDLSESEITLLQKLDARQPVGPGGSVDFAIVFLEPPRDLREFSSRVLTARSTARASAPAARLLDPASVG